jgi:hypothetical protein
LVDVRIYRAAFLPVVAVLITVMFSIQDRPPPLTPSLAPDAFDSKGAYATTLEIMRRAPDRRPGSSGDAAIADLVEGRFQSLPGLGMTRDEFSSEVDGRKTPMTNVIGTLSGPSTRQVVLMANRDAAGRPGASTAADTATLLELAKVLAGVRHDKTIVLVSADGSTADNAGARRFAAEYPERNKIDGMLVVHDIAAASANRPFLIPWSTDPKRGSLQLLRTADAALKRELSSDVGSESVASQFIRLAWPLTLRPQGPLVSEDIDALTLTAAGEVPRGSEPDGIEDVSRLREAHFGRAALSTVLALDSSGGESSPPSYLVWGRKVVPGWAVSLLAFALLAPVVAAALDGFARARRRGRPIGLQMRWTLATAVPFLVLFGAAFVFELFDWLPHTASEAIAPASRPSFSEAAPALCGLALVFGIAWLVLRPVAMGPARGMNDGEPEEAVGVALVLSLAMLALWFVNPFAVLLLVPAAHLCLLFAMPGSRGRPALVVTTAMAALLLPVLALLYYGTRFDLGLDLNRYALMLVVGGGSLWHIVLVSVIAGSLTSLLLLAFGGRREPERIEEITIRGPTSYAGPGSLGGTESAYHS